MVSVMIPGYTGFATLESATGQIVGDRLQGPFHIRFGRQATRDILFGGAADTRLRVNTSANRHELVEAEAILFPFADLLTISGSGPQVFATELKLIFESGKERPSLIFSTASASLIGGYPPARNATMIASPAATPPGVTLTQVRGTRDPISKHIGFPIVPGTRGFELRFGQRDNQFNISHVPSAVVQVGAKAGLAILIGGPDGSPLARLTMSGSGPDQETTKRIRLGVPKSARLALQSFTSGQPSDAFARSVSIEGNLLSVDEFHGASFEAAALDANRATLARLNGDAEQFRFSLKLPTMPGTPPEGTLAQLQFTDRRVIEDRPYTKLAERFHGLSVSGLASVRTAKECLDCSHATATLDGGQPFVLRAGVPLDYLGGGHEPAPRLIAKRAANGERRLELMVAALRLVGSKSFTLDTDKARFEIHDPALHGRPNGPAAPLDAQFNVGSYAWWELRSPDALALRLGPDILSPEDENWSKSFDYAADQPFRLVEHPGASLTMRRAPDSLGKLLSDKSVERSELAQYKEPGGKEYLAYSAFFAILTYGYVRHVQAGEGEMVVGEKDIALQLRLLKEDTKVLESYAKSVAPGDLRVLMEGGDADSEAALNRFIDANLKGGNANPEKVLFPLLGPIAILLRQRADGTVSNAFDIAAKRRPGATPRFAVDFSEVQSLGLDWSAIADNDKALWPALSKTDAKARDPSHAGWKGLFFQDLPLNISLPPAALALIRKDFKNLGEFLDTLNASLMLDYGWRDENGATWSSRLEPTKPIEISPGALKSFLSIQIERAIFLGSVGKPVRAGATINASLPFLAEDPDNPPRLIGDFDFGFSDENPIGRVALRSDKGPIGTKAIPGFDAVRLAGFSTDFRTAQADLELYPSPKLKTVIDAFDLPPGTPFKAALQYDLKDQRPESLALVTDHEIRTKLFGKWPLVIQSLRLELGDRPSLKFKCQLELGFPNLRSIAVDVALQRKGNDWDFAIIPERVGASLGIGDFDLGIEVGWRNDAQIKNEFWGKIKLSGGPIKVDQQMQLRIGSSGGRPYWIAGASLPDIRIGPAKILKPILLMGRGAELPGLASVITDPSKNLKMLRDSQTGKTEEDWLKEWRPSTSMGTVFAASGFFSFDERLAGSAEKKEDQKKDGKYLTNIVFTDNGLLRIDGWFRLMSTDELMTRVVFGYNPEKGEIAAGVQLPRIKLPGQGETKIEVYPGFAYFRISYRGNLSFTYSVGWPEKVDGPGIERDWEKATKVFIADAWPINTFWGGMLVDYRAGQSVTLGFAIRAGWTRSYPGVGAKGIAWAEAELGIAVGGVLVVNFGEPREQQLLPASPHVLRPAHGSNAVQIALAELPAPDIASETETEDPVFAARALVQPYFEALRAEAMRAEVLTLSGLPEVSFTAELFGDIWGRGSAEFLGVNIASVSISAYARFEVKGSTQKGITLMRSITGYKVNVTILCVSYSAHVEVEIWIIRRAE